MLLLLLAFFGGILTILSPCILPILPFVFSRVDRPFRKSGLPLLAGMVLTFAVVASLVTIGAGWAVQANQVARVAALVLFGIFGLALLFPTLADRLSRPLVRLGGKLAARRTDSSQASSSFMLGIATGLLWTPCAGPILGLILTGAALNGANTRSALLLLAYAAGAATSLGAVLVAGGRLLPAAKRSLKWGNLGRRVIGAAVLASVAVVSLGLDRGVLTRVSLANSSQIEQSLLDHFHPVQQPNHQEPPAGAQPRPVMEQTITVTDDPPLDALSRATAWINSPPLTAASLKGKVVLVDFWTYSCINCLRTLPYVKSWYARYKDSGLVVIGVHTPEFPFEKDEANVRSAVERLGIPYPVAMDNNYAIWRSFHNQYWPADYFIDASGRIRFHHFGEGKYQESEAWIRQLLEQAHQKFIPGAQFSAPETGVEAPSDLRDLESPETYIGYRRAQNFASVGGLDEDRANRYTLPYSLNLNQWGLDGRWKAEAQFATLLAAPGAIAYHFHARDLHLVLGLAPGAKPVRFRILLDGKPPGNDHGVDTDAEGFGTVTNDRLYQMVRQTGKIRDRIFTIEFFGSSVRAFSFTFG